MDDHTKLEFPSLVTPPARLKLSLFGPPRVTLNGKVVLEERHQKPLTLLAYLAIEAGRPHQRTVLTALFWPDQPDRQALQNLRKTLSRLRRAIGDQTADPPHLLIDPQTIQFNPHSDYWLDVTAFKKLVDGVQAHPHRRLEVCPACLLRLAQAVEYYRGDFLANVYSVGSISFDDWLIIRREQLTRQACIALQALANAHLTHGKYETTCRYARRLLHLDPWNEAGQRLLLQAILMRDGRNAALQQYETFREALAGELGVEPEDETLALVDQIQKDAFPGGQLRTPATRHPTPATPFVGREAEREQITDYLAGYERRLLTLKGPGGSGKSRLALEIINEQAPLWRDGVWFISLADVPNSEGLAGALASTIGYQPEGSLEVSGLIEYLKPESVM